MAYVNTLYKNVSWIRYKTLLLTEKIMCDFSGFYQGLSGCYMIFMNYIAALTLTKKITLLQFFSDCAVKTRPSKAKVLIRKFFPITHSIIYYNLKAKKSFLRCRGHWGSWKSWRSSVIGSSLGSSAIIFSLGFSMFRSFLDFSVVGSSLWSSVIGSFLSPQW